MCRRGGFNSAAVQKIEDFMKRMGWLLKWVSSYGTDFNYDYRASFTQEEVAKGKVEYFDLVEFPSAEAPGISVFYKDQNGSIFHTYSAYASRERKRCQHVLSRPCSERPR